MTRLLILSHSSPRDLQLLLASGTEQSLFHWILNVVPFVPRLEGEVIHPSLRNSIVETRINRFVDGRPWHAGCPEILQTKSYTIFEVVSRVQHEGMPNHKNVYSGQ
jgi:hypothetical protein